MKNIKKHLFIIAFFASSVLLTAGSFFVVNCLDNYAGGMLHETEVHNSNIASIYSQYYNGEILPSTFYSSVIEENTRHGNAQSQLWGSYSSCCCTTGQCPC